MPEGTKKTPTDAWNELSELIQQQLGHRLKIAELYGAMVAPDEIERIFNDGATRELLMVDAEMKRIAGGLTS